MEEGLRTDNPAEQTRRPRRQPTAVYRLTRQEAASMLAAAHGKRERRAIYLGICAGLRNAELCGLRGGHFARDGFVWVSADIAKGGRERWVPLLPDLEPIVADIRAHVSEEEYVLPSQRFRNPPWNTAMVDIPNKACSPLGAAQPRHPRRPTRRHRSARSSAPAAPRLWRPHRPLRRDAQRAVPARARGDRDDRDLRGSAVARRARGLGPGLQLR